MQNSDEEEKTARPAVDADEAPAAPPQRDDTEEQDVTEQLCTLNAKFSVFTQQVLERLDSILELKQIVNQLCEGKKAQRQAEAAKKREQRAAVRSIREDGLLPLPGMIFKKDPRIGLKYLLWAHVGIQMGLTGQWRMFLQYIAHDWNVNTYLKKPIARISNKCHYWDHGVRHECSWCDMFGSERGLTPKTTYEILWWEFRYHMVEIVERLIRMPEFCNLKKEFIKALQVACGDMAAMFDESQFKQLRSGNYDFDQNDAECLEKVPEFKYLALHVLQSFRRGISKGVDEDLELIRQGKMTFLCHCNTLEKDANMLRFQHNLRKGELPPEMLRRAHELDELGFFKFEKVVPFPKVF